MNLSSKKNQVIFFAAPFLFCFAVLAWGGYSSNVKCFIIDVFNFMSEVNPSGILIFAGIAAGISYRRYQHVFYRSAAFVCGFLFAISQSVSAAMDNVYRGGGVFCQTPSDVVVFLSVSMVFCGVGFVWFSFLAMIAHENEQKIPKEGGRPSKIEGEPSENFSINLNLSLKTDDVPSAPALSDLAHDLRHSRSHARRYRARR